MCILGRMHLAGRKATGSRPFLTVGGTSCCGCTGRSSLGSIRPGGPERSSCSPDQPGAGRAVGASAPAASRFSKARRIEPGSGDPDCRRRPGTVEARSSDRSVCILTCHNQDWQDALGWSAHERCRPLPDIKTGAQNASRPAAEGRTASGSNGSVPAASGQPGGRPQRDVKLMWTVGRR